MEDTGTRDLLPRAAGPGVLECDWTHYLAQGSRPSRSRNLGCGESHCGHSSKPSGLELIPHSPNDNLVRIETYDDDIPTTTTTNDDDERRRRRSNPPSMTAYVRYADPADTLCGYRFAIPAVEGEDEDEASPSGQPTTLKEVLMLRSAQLRSDQIRSCSDGGGDSSQASSIIQD